MRDARGMAHHSALEIPGDLPARLEVARLDLLALFRALDRMDLSPAEIPQRLLRQLFELDADFAEALWSLDQPEGNFDRRAMLRDTFTALYQLPTKCAQFSETTTGPRAAHLGTTRGQRPQDAEPQRGLQYGARQRSRKRLSTLLRVGLTTVLGYVCAKPLPLWLGIDPRWGVAGLTAWLCWLGGLSLLCFGAG